MQIQRIRKAVTGLMFNTIHMRPLTQRSDTRTNQTSNSIGYGHNDLTSCLSWAKLKMDATSRSFGVIVKFLPSELSDVVTIYYLVLRALDSIEDDMRLNIGTKSALLIEFASNLKDTTWNVKGCGESIEEIDLLENFNKITYCLHHLNPTHSDTIINVCQEMGNSMAHFLTNPIQSLSDWDNYCYSVAGIVGIGLERIWTSSGFEKHLQSPSTVIALGLFLQKVNIILDVRKDLLQGRVFWPSEVYTKYLDSMSDMFNGSSRHLALSCLNELISHAISHTQTIISYLEQVQQPRIFYFCATPFIVGLATLRLCYNNYNVFLKPVKIPREEALGIFANATDFRSVIEMVEHYNKIILTKIPESLE